MTVKRFYGRGAIPGRAEGPALISRRTIMGWGGIDIHTGVIVEKGHPLEGMCLKDTVLILDGSKGSNGWSLFFHSAQVSGFGPAALVFPRLDSRTAVTAAVLNVPLVTDVDPAVFDLVRVGDRVRVDGDTGLIEIVSQGDTP
jgi:predicted aconitase with swiveling domain